MIQNLTIKLKIETEHERIIKQNKSSK